MQRAEYFLHLRDKATAIGAAPKSRIGELVFCWYRQLNDEFGSRKCGLLDDYSVVQNAGILGIDFAMTG